MAINPEASDQTKPGQDRFHPRSEFMELVEYDRANATMTIHFKHGTTKRYLFCFPGTYETFKQSPSADTFFSKAIKGRLISVTLKSKTIGRERTHPLKAVKQRRTLDYGVRTQTERVKRIGTVARAGL